MPGGREYVLVYNPNHPRSNNKGYVYKHYLVAEQILNRPLKKGETVHHKDQNKRNNSIDNIMIFASSSDHTAFHNGSEIYVEDGVWHAKLRTRLKNGKRRKRRSGGRLFLLINSRIARGRFFDHLY